MKKIYRTYADTEVSELATRIECPYCKNKWQEDGMSEPGETYQLTCSNDWDEVGCGKSFEMYFDVD